jgi:ribosome-binding protein aMBF1 (putative translation factor)
MKYNNAQELVNAAINRRTSRAELARELAISPETLTSYAVGRRKPSYDVTMKLLRITSEDE